MPRLHARDDAELREPPEVVGVHELHVHELVPGVPGSVHAPGVRDGVERRADPAVAGRVGERLEAAPFELHDRVGEGLGLVERATGVAGVAGVGLEQPGRARLDHVVDVDLHGPHAEPIVVVSAPGLLELAQVEGGLGGVADPQP